MANKTVIGFSNVHGTKSIDLPQYPDSAWTFLSGAPEGEDSVRALTKAVPWLNRGLSVLVQSASEVPIMLMRGENEMGYFGDEVDSPFNYIEDLPLLIKKLTASIVLEGYGYAFRDMARMKAVSLGIKTKKLWYWSPLTVEFDAQKTLRERQLYFKRSVPGQGMTEFTDKDVLYFWPPDPYVEVGPPTSSPAKAALAAAGVLHDIDQYVKKYFDKGAVRAYIFSKEGEHAVRGRTEESLEKMTDAFTGVGNAFKAAFMSLRLR